MIFNCLRRCQLPKQGMEAPRLFVPCAIATGELLALSEEQIHKLLHVLRLRAGAGLRVFNGQDGEFSAALEAKGKSFAARAMAQIRAQSASRDLRLLFAPLKRQANDWLVEKATELGVAVLQPVMTQRCVAERIRLDRIALIAQSSAEQSERVHVPEVHEAISLQHALQAWPARAKLVFADEAGDDPHAAWGGQQGRAPPLLAALAGLGDSPSLGLLVGPEGGFAPEERAALRALPFVVPVSLGPRILRAETAALVGLSLIQAQWGDWAAPLC